VKYWLFKSDPEEFGWPDLWKSPKHTTAWVGVRNYQARNMLRDDVAVDDQLLFYHSSTNPPAAVGIAQVVRAGYPEKEAPWVAVDIQAKTAFKRPVTLEEMRAVPGLAEMVLLRKGSRLSIQPVTAAEWRIITGLGGVR
jgi:predicted RNA-binding protein with PUA-like domain